jgi:hypothetical protein
MSLCKVFKFSGLVLVCKYEVLHSSDLCHVHSKSIVNEYSVLVHEFQWFEPCFCEGTSHVVGI